MRVPSDFLHIILIWFEALDILHRYAKKAKLKKFSDTSYWVLKVGHFDVFYWKS